MDVFNKKENFQISDKSLFYSPQSIIDFIVKFNEEFNTEIIAVDVSSENRTFKIHYLFYKEGIQKDIIIEISNYDAELKYFLETKGVSEISFRSIYKNQVGFIKTFL